MLLGWHTMDFEWWDHSDPFAVAISFERCWKMGRMECLRAAVRSEN